MNLLHIKLFYYRLFKLSVFVSLKKFINLKLVTISLHKLLKVLICGQKVNWCLQSSKVRFMAFIKTVNVFSKQGYHFLL